MPRNWPKFEVCLLFYFAENIKEFLRFGANRKLKHRVSEVYLVSSEIILLLVL